MTSLPSSLTARRGTPEWDAVLRATGIVALVAIYPASRWPDVAALAVEKQSGQVDVAAQIGPPLVELPRALGHRHHGVG